MILFLLLGCQDSCAEWIGKIDVPRPCYGHIVFIERPDQTEDLIKCECNE